MFSSICKSVFGLSVALLLVNLAGATTINVDMVPGSDSVYSGTAAAPDTGTFWNKVQANAWSTSSGSNFKASDGSTVTGVGFTTIATFGNTDFAGMGSSGSNNLLDDGAQMWMITWPYRADLELTGLSTSQKYDLYLYGTAGSTAYGTAFTIGGVTQITAGGNDTSFVKGGSTLVTGSNYVLFQNLMSDGTGAISIQAYSNSIVTGIANGSSDSGPVNGLQLVSVPEPGTLVLLVVGLVGLLAYAWRKRR